jgi:large subunit ribosomal protein L2
MGIKSYKPTTPSKRGTLTADFAELTAKKPEKSLLFYKHRHVGRGNSGVSTRHKGGGVKKRFRLIDLKQEKLNIPGKVKAIEYDPTRTSRIALIFYKDGSKIYILAPQGLKVGDEIIAAEKTPNKPGNRAMLKFIPTSTSIHNVELQPGRGGQIARSAGNSAILLSKEGKYVTVQMPSKEIRKFLGECYASIGALSFPEHSALKIGKAGRNRWKGIRPSVRGLAMSPNSHPHGGGEGRSSIGMPSPKSPWGQKTLGYKTRKKNKINKLIIRKRK